MSLNTRDTQYLIIGGGAAGLRAAAELLESGKDVIILAKEDILESNTEYAQGGVAVALSDEDKIGFHLDDTLRAGDGICNEEAVRILVEEGPRYIEELIEWGVDFDREGTSLAFTKEGAHSRSRILHAGGDSTGGEVMRALVSKVKSYDTLEYLSYYFAVDLVVRDGRCRGAICLDEKTGEMIFIRSSAVLMATGGLGKVYKETTNPSIATGDGHAMGFRAGAVMRDMEFVQFHPTVLYKEGAPRFLMTESLRGEGARLRNEEGGLFMKRYHPAAELAPRDVVSRAILSEIRATGSESVFLDLTHLRPKYVKKRFPKIFKTCRIHGIDITEERIPVRPCAHYMMGGIKSDLQGRTGVEGLYAAGECACTGVHGANRLASNSLLEGIVYGGRAGKAILENGDGPAGTGYILDYDPPMAEPGDSHEELRRYIQDLMWRDVGINRCGESLTRTMKKLMDIKADFGTYHPEKRYHETLNILLNARMITDSALRRLESRGCHYRSDHPKKKEELRKHSELNPADRPEFLSAR